MSVHQCKKTKRWYVKYRVDGKQVSKWFGTGKKEKEAAEAFGYDLKAMKKRHQELPTRSGVYFDSVAQAYLNDAKMRGASQAWLRDFSNLLNKVFLPALCKKPVDALGYEDILAIMDQYKNHEQSTRNRYLEYLRGAFNFGIKHGMTKNTPLAHWRKTKERPRQSTLTVEGLRLIMKHAPEHLRWTIEVEWNLGARPGPSELFAIKWQHINFEEHAISLYGSKTKRWREIPVSPEFIECLKDKRRIAKSEYVIEFRGHGVKRVNNSWKTAIEKAQEEAQKEGKALDHCTLYDIRHLFATTLLNQGADLAAVSALLGHHSTHMTANQYYHLMAGEKRNAVNKLPSLNASEQKPAKVLQFNRNGG